MNNKQKSKKLVSCSRQESGGADVEDAVADGENTKAEEIQEKNLKYFSEEQV